MINDELAKLNQIELLLNRLCNLIQHQQKFPKNMGIVTQKELLNILQISPNTLKSWENTGLKRLEPPIEGTRTIFYLLDDIINFLKP